MDMGMGAGATDSSAFCQGEGRVMLSGFQEAYGDNGFCVKFLFENAVIDTEAKYVFAVLGTMCMGLTIEALVLVRKVYTARYISVHTELPGIGVYVPLSLLYGVQMVVAYWAMLLVMLYETFIFTALIVGLVVGHFLFEVVLARRFPELHATLLADNNPSPGTACCGGTAKNGVANPAAGAPAPPTAAGAAAQGCCAAKQPAAADSAGCGVDCACADRKILVVTEGTTVEGRIVTEPAGDYAA
eukprot:gene5582-8497_t